MKTINSSICIDCICLPACLSKHLIPLIKQCKLMTHKLVEMSSIYTGKGDESTIHFHGLNRDIDIMIYTNIIYVLQPGKGTPILAINKENFRTLI